MAYWHFGLSIAQKWRERLGLQRHAEWDEILAKLAPLATSPDGIYLPAEKGRGIPDFVNGIPAEKLPEMPAGGYINGQRPKEADGSVSLSEGEKSKRKHDPFMLQELLLKICWLTACCLSRGSLIKKNAKDFGACSSKLELVRRILELELSHIGNECYSPVAA